MHNHVRYYREQRRMTQSELARRIGVDSQTIWNIEHHAYKHRPRFSTMRHLSEVLGVPVEQLFVDEEDEDARHIA
jgi:DNA-binding XRE family transcriptional regulator